MILWKVDIDFFELERNLENTNNKHVASLIAHW